jgi:hypothetical protein
MARPRKHVDVVQVLALRLAGHSWPEIARRTNLGLGTVYRAYRAALVKLQPFQNSKPRIFQTMPGDKSAARQGVSVEAGKRISPDDSGMASALRSEDRAGGGLRVG